MDVKKVTTYAATGQGTLVVEQLMRVLQDIPGNAYVSVSQDDSQREGSWWRVEAKLQE